MRSGIPLQRRLLVVLPDTRQALRFLEVLKALAKQDRVFVVIETGVPVGDDRLANASAWFPNLTFGNGPSRDGAEAELAGVVRETLDLWHLDANVDDPWLRVNRTQPDVHPAALRLARHPLARTAGIRSRVTRLLQDIEAMVPPAPEVLGMLEPYQPDIVVVSQRLGSLAADYILAARHMGVRVVSVLDTWDGTTARGLVHAWPDAMTVWTSGQRREIASNQGYPGQRVAVVGASCAEPWFRRSSKHSEFCEARGWKTTVPIVLFAASEEGSAQRDIERFEHWWRTAASHSDTRLSGMHALVCPHPLHPHAWREVKFPTDCVFINPPDKFLKAVHICDAVVTMDMTGVLEGAALGRPVIAMCDQAGRVAAAEVARFAGRHAVNRTFLSSVADATGACDALSQRFVELETHTRDLSGFPMVAPHGIGISTSLLMRRTVLTEVLTRPGLVAPARPVSTWAKRVTPRLRAWVAAGPHRVPALAPATPRRVLVAVPTFNLVAPYHSVLETLVAEGHRVSVALGVPAPPEAESVPGVSYDGALKPRADRWTRLAKSIRGLAYCDRLLDAQGPWSGVPGLDRFLRKVLLPGSRGLLAVMKRIGRNRAARWWLSLSERSLPLSAPACELLERERPDLLLVIPALDAFSGLDTSAPQVDLIAAARRHGVRTLALAANADTSINDAMLHAQPHAVLVWTDRQRQEARSRLGPGVGVHVIGAGPFDEWLQGSHENPKRERSSVCSAFGLPDRPFVLFAGSGGFVNDPAREVGLALEWVAALRKHSAARVRKLPVLIRPAPGDTRAWRHADFAGLGPVVLCPFNYEDDGALDTVLLRESIRSAAVVVSAEVRVLTMAIVLGTPAVGALAGGGGTTERTMKHLFPDASWRWVSDVPGLVSATAKALKAESPDRDSSRETLRRFVRPEGASQASSSLMLREIANLCTTLRPWPAEPLAGGFAVRWALRFGFEGLAMAGHVRRHASLRGLRAAVSRLLRPATIIKRLMRRSKSAEGMIAS